MTFNTRKGFYREIERSIRAWFFFFFGSNFLFLMESRGGVVLLCLVAGVTLFTMSRAHKGYD